MNRIPERCSDSRSKEKVAQNETMTKLAKRVERGFIKGNEIVRDKKIWDTHLQRSPTVLIIRSSVEGPVQQAVGDVLLTGDPIPTPDTPTLFKYPRAPAQGIPELPNLIPTRPEVGLP
eukprot:935336-Prorocentrum_minimum.AAC.2